MGLSAFQEIKQETRSPATRRPMRWSSGSGAGWWRRAGSEFPASQREFVVFNSDQLNAFALPGGKVGVYSGMLNLIGGDEAELATVIGHEIGHVTANHAAQRVGTSQSRAWADRAGRGARGLWRAHGQQATGVAADFWWPGRLPLAGARRRPPGPRLHGGSRYDPSRRSSSGRRWPAPAAGAVPVSSPPTRPTPSAWPSSRRSARGRADLPVGRRLMRAAVLAIACSPYTLPPRSPAGALARARHRSRPAGAVPEPSPFTPAQVADAKRSPPPQRLRCGWCRAGGQCQPWCRCTARAACSRRARRLCRQLAAQGAAARSWTASAPAATLPPAMSTGSSPSPRP